MRNVFYPVDVATVQEVSWGEESFEQPGSTVIENLTSGKNITPNIRILDISLNHETTYVEVSFIGVSGEGYTVKVNEGVSKTLISEQIMVYYSTSPYPIPLTLVKGRTYEFTLFDVHNTPQDVFSFVSPIDFQYVEPLTAVATTTTKPLATAQTQVQTQVQSQVQTQAQSQVQSSSLPKTSDHTLGASIFLLISLVIVVAISTIKKLIKKEI